jgi:serine/threonine protein kinase
LADRKLIQIPDYPKIPLEKIVTRASREAISLMEWMLQYNPKNRPRPSEILSHEFFKTKQLLTATKQLETTADTNTSNMMRSNNSPSAMIKIEETPLKNKKANVRNSIEGP